MWATVGIYSVGPISRMRIIKRNLFTYVRKLIKICTIRIM